MRTLYIFIFCTALAFISCEKTVDANKLLDTEEKVTITSYISPIDTLLRVKVSKALPAIGTVLSNNDEDANRELFLIKDAVVRISDEEGNTANFSYLEEEATYISDAANLAIMEGKQYFLNVVANGKEFNATCTIPKSAPEILEIVRILDNDFGSVIAEIDITFKDITGQRNFYVLGGSTEEIYDEETFVNPLFFDSDGLLTDAVEDGITLGETAKVYLGEQGDTQPKEVILQVAHVDEIVFQNMQASNLNSYNDGNPFVEYSISPNNIEGENGVGLFAGYQVSEKIIVVEE